MAAATAGCIDPPTVWQSAASTAMIVISSGASRLSWRASAKPTHKMTKPYPGAPPTANHPWKQRYDGMKVWRPLRPGLDETETALGLPLRSALNARPLGSQGFASGQAQSDPTEANHRGHF